MNRLERALRDHRNALNAIDRAVLGNLLNEYEQVMTRLNPKIELLVQEIQGQDYASLTQLLRVTRMQELQRQIMAEMDGLAAKTEGITRIGQARAVNHAVDGAQTITSASVAGNPATVMTSYNRINPGAVQDFIGATQSGPLQELLSSFGETVERAMINALTDGIALGTNPRGIADIIRRSTDIGRNRALTIARTEVLRAYRSATLQNYQANADIMKGWIWLSAKQTRTCAACLAMDGTFHEFSETMASHPNCRCTMRPALKNAPMRNVKTGKQWLDGQAPDAQDAVLGKAGGAAYRAGEVELSDFVKVTESQDWGKTTTDGGVAFARLNAARRNDRSAFEQEFRQKFERKQSEIQPQPNVQKPIERRDIDDFKTDLLDLKISLSDSGYELEKTLTDQQRIDISQYKGRSYKPINAFLRTGEMPDVMHGSSPEIVRDSIRTLDEVFSNPITKLTTDAKVYRGARFPYGTTPQEFKDFRPGYIFPEKGFSSTTYDLKIAEKFSGGYNSDAYMFEIYVPKGTSAIGTDRFGGSTVEFEAEVLLNRNTNYLIHEITKVGERTWIKVEVLP